MDMTRGRPSKEQLEIAMPMLKGAGSYNYSAEAADARNYGDLGGTKACKALFAELFGVKSEEVFVGDGSSLDLMYTLVHFAKQFGVLGSTPWNNLKKVKFICPAPGYDRHFSICQQFGIEMVTVRMKDDGPDMDVVEALVREDDSIKGIWCVPKYSNPTGITFSDSVVDRLATMKTAANDFRIFWDNAYMVHSLYDTDDKLKNIFDVARKAGTPDRIYSFASTSKITFAGSGISAIAASEANIKDITGKMFFKCINANKVNQVMHVNFLKNADGVREVMKSTPRFCVPSSSSSTRSSPKRSRATNSSGGQSRARIFHLRRRQILRETHSGAGGDGGSQIHRRRRHFPLSSGRYGQQHPRRAFRAFARRNGICSRRYDFRNTSGAYGARARKDEISPCAFARTRQRQIEERFPPFLFCLRVRSARAARTEGKTCRGSDFANFPPREA